jgi:uncharacterized protein (TIGR02001 family)
MSMAKSFTKAVGAASVVLLALTGAASAEDREFSWSVTLAGTSDYIFRGLSLNGEDPAFQPSINASYGILYFGAWGSNVDGDGYEPWETDLYAGITPALGPVTFDFGVVYYIYPGAETGGSLGLDYVEFKAGASYSPVDKLTFKPTFWYVPDQENSVEVYAIEGTLAYELPQMAIFTPTVSGLVGYTEEAEIGLWSNTTDNYTYWNAGIALGVEKFTFDFRYWDTDLPDTPGDVYHGLADERFVFTASVTLP